MRRAPALICLVLSVLAVAPVAVSADTQPRFPDAAYIDDTVRPTGYMGRAGLSKRLQTGRSFTVEWDAVDRGGQIADMDVRVRSAPINAGFGPWRTWLRKTQLVTARYRGAPGRTYCFAVRGTDWVGNVGAWSRERCTATPLGAASLRIRSARDWRFEAGSRDLGRARATAGPDAILSSAPFQASRVALIATRCPGCGTLEVHIDGQVRTISLEARTERRKQLVPVVTFSSVRSAVLVLRVVGPRPVRIEGLAVTRATDAR